MADDGRLDIKLTADDQLTPALNDAKKATDDVVGATEKVGQSSLKWTELKSQIDLVVGAAKQIYAVFEQIEELQIAGAIDKNLNAAFERTVGKLKELESLRGAVNYTQEDTDIVRFSNTLARYGATLSDINIIIGETKRVSDDLGLALGDVQSQVIGAFRSGSARALRSTFGETADLVALQVDLYEKLNGTLDDTARRTMTMTLLTEELAKNAQFAANAAESQTDRYNKESAAMANLSSNIGIALDSYEKLDEGNTFLTQSYTALANIFGMMDDEFMKQWNAIDITAMIMQTAGTDAQYMATGIGMARAEFTMAAIQGKAFTEQIEDINDQFNKLAISTLMGAEGVNLLWSVMNEGAELGPVSDPSVLAAQRAEEIETLLKKMSEISLASSKTRASVSADMDAVAQKAGNGVKMFVKFLDSYVDGIFDRQAAAMQVTVGQMEMFAMRQRTIFDAVDNEILMHQLSFNAKRVELTMAANEQIKQSHYDLGGAIEASLAFAASTVGSVLGNLASGVSLSGKQAVAGMLDILGTFALAVGPLLIAAGGGFSALFSFNGPGAIAAGLILIAAGAGLKAAAANLRAAGESGAATGTGQTTFGFGTTTQGGGAFSPRDTATDEGGGTTVVYNFFQTMLTADGARAVVNGINQSSGRTSGRLKPRVLSYT
jgi:hypothetical protein